MQRSFSIENSKDVMAMFGKIGSYYVGRWENVIVTGIGFHELTPLNIRKSLVGLIIPTIFTKESIEEQIDYSYNIPENSRFAYVQDVVDALQSAGKHTPANLLKKISPHSLSMYIIENENYDLVNNG